MQKSKLSLSNFVLLFIVIIVVFLISIQGNLTSMDEIWTFQFARRILYKQVPYRDYFMIISPLKAQIDAILLRFFSDQLIVLRWFALILANIHGFLLYRLSVKLGLTKNSSLLVVFVFFLTFIIFPINNYNWFSLLLIVILLFPLSSPIDKKNALWIGFLISLLILTKQNIGLYMIAGVSFFYYLTKNKFYIFSLIGFFLGFIPEMLYFWAKGSLEEFLEIFYANWIPFFQAHFRSNPLTTLIILSILILFLLVVLLMRQKLKITSEKNNLALLIIICLIVLGYSFPLFDVVHFIFLLPFLCLLILVRWNIQIKDLLYFVFFLIFLNGYSWFLLLPTSHPTNLPHLLKVPINKDYANTIQEVSRFLIEQKEVGKNPFEIDYSTALFDVVLDRLGYKYDSMQKGNFGINGENEFILMIANDPNAVAIFDERKQKTKITEYVIKNMTYKKTIAKSFLVYEK